MFHKVNINFCILLLVRMACIVTGLIAKRHPTCGSTCLVTSPSSWVTARPQDGPTSEDWVLMGLSSQPTTELSLNWPLSLNSPETFTLQLLCQVLLARMLLSRSRERPLQVRVNFHKCKTIWLVSKDHFFTCSLLFLKCRVSRSRYVVTRSSLNWTIDELLLEAF